MCTLIFEATLHIKPLTWKRTTGKSRRVMPAKQREYYARLYMALYDAGMKPLDPAREFGLSVVFHCRGSRVGDLSNYIKALEDAGQVSKWRTKSMNLCLLPDFWDDKQFSEIHARRISGADEDKIEIKIWL